MEPSDETDAEMLRVALRKLHFRQAEMAKELTAANRERDEARAVAKLVTTDEREVWYYMGDGSDEPASISCPVVMDAETFRLLLVRANTKHADYVDALAKVDALSYAIRRLAP
jgi:hypothetical protein